MNKQFLYLDYETRTIEGREFIVISVLEFYRKQVFKIYKLQTTELVQKLEKLKHFENINNNIDFVIKRDNKISLDIKF